MRRPFDADPNLRDLLNETITRRHSVVQRIWHSDMLSARLKRRIKENTESPTGNSANLNAAKHRFESYAAPLGRSLQHLEEFLDVVQETCDERGSSKEGCDCWDWLQGLTNEKMYQLAMLADCSDELLVATREMDQEDLDTGTLHETVNSLLNRLDALFNKKKCLEVPGYVQHVLKVLERPRLIYGPGGILKSIGGGNPQEDLQVCFHRMQACIALIADVAGTEFPHHELFCAFNIFSSLGDSAPSNSESALKRIAQAFNLDLPALRSQFHRLRMVAAQKKKDGTTDNKLAWREAVLGGRRGNKEIWTTNALLPALWRYVGWTAATSGVEQNFSQGLRAIGSRRGFLSTQHEETALKFAVYKPDDRELNDVVARARELWAKHYGAPRQMTQQRCDKGVSVHEATCSETATSAKNSEKAWLRKRRSAASEVGRQVDNASSMTIENARNGSGWTIDHDKEHEFQAKKRAKKELQALADGFLLEHEIRPDMQEALEEVRKRDATADAAFKRKRQRQQALQKRVNLTIKVGTVASIHVSGNKDNLVQVLRSKGARIVDDLSLEVQLLVVDNPAKLTNVQCWVAALNGLLVCSREAVSSLQERKQDCGALLKYKRAIDTKRKLYVTDAFVTKHVAISSLIKDACQLRAGQWKLLNAIAPGCIVLGGPEGKSTKGMLKEITCIIRTESRAR